MRESKLYSEDQLKAFVDIDETICFYEDKRIYELAIPNIDNINKKDETSNRAIEISRIDLINNNNNSRQQQNYNKDDVLMNKREALVQELTSLYLAMRNCMGHALAERERCVTQRKEMIENLQKFRMRLTDQLL